MRSSAFESDMLHGTKSAGEQQHVRTEHQILPVLWSRSNDRRRTHLSALRGTSQERRKQETCMANIISAELCGCTRCCLVDVFLGYRLVDNSDDGRRLVGDLQHGRSRTELHDSARLVP